MSSRNPYFRLRWLAFVIALSAPAFAGTAHAEQTATTRSSYVVRDGVLRTNTTWRSKGTEFHHRGDRSLLTGKVVSWDHQVMGAKSGNRHHSWRDADGESASGQEWVRKNSDGALTNFYRSIRADGSWFSKFMREAANGQQRGWTIEKRGETFLVKELTKD